MHPRLLGSLIAFAIFAPLTAFAKATMTGRYLLVAVCLFVFAMCAMWRIYFGQWPGDEFRHD